MECTQFIRGELWVYFDSYLILYNEMNQVDLKKMIDFARYVFLLFFKWVEIFPKYADLYKLNKQYPDLFAVDLKTAVAMCGYELIEMIGVAFGVKSRGIEPY